MSELMKRTIELKDIDVEKFVSTLNQCKDAVWLETDEGDKLNLKSTLCQIMGLASLIKGGTIANATIRCGNAEDDALLFRLGLWNISPDEKN